MQTIRLGSKGDDVILWQRILVRFRAPSAWRDARGVERRWSGEWPLRQDGDFGALTEQATEAWQAAHGLVADGVVGPKTWSAAGAVTEATPVEPSPTGDIELVPAKNFTRGRLQPVRLIIVHAAESQEVEKSARGTAGWFQSQPARGTRVDDNLKPDPNGTRIWGGSSAHYCVDANETVQCVAESDVAWHAHAVNGYSLGIEHAGRTAQTAAQWDDDFSRKMLTRSAQLVAGICARHGIPVKRLTPDEVRLGQPGIAGHVDVTMGLGPPGGHTDPGPGFPWEKYLALIRAAAPAPSSEVEDQTPAPGGGASATTTSLGEENTWAEVELDGELWEVALDYVYPVSLAEAAQLARASGCELPTPRLVDAIWQAASVRLDATTLRRSDFVHWTMAEMSSPAVLADQKTKIRDKIAELTKNAPTKPFLCAGSHKDVVVSSDGRLALYGWQNEKGIPLQPVYGGHIASWRDYSQGARMVRRATRTATIATRSLPTAELLGAALLDVPVDHFVRDQPRIRGRSAAASSPGDLPVSDASTLTELTAALDTSSEPVLAAARAAWDGNLTEEALRRALAAAKSMVAEAPTTATALRAARSRSRAANPMPPEFDFPRYDPENIPLDVESTKFETWADAPGWALMCGPAMLGSAFGSKAPFERASHSRLFHYARPAPTATAPVTIALFSDFATGLPHSRYIAKHLTHDAARFDCAIHLGDIYYAGRRVEADEYLVKPLARLVETTTLLTLPGNHEMYSNGHAFFEAMHARRAAAPYKQVQEGSYFSLQYGDYLQIVGIDSDYFDHGRYEDPELRTWLEMVLRWGRQAGRINVLLSGNEAFTYGKKSTTKLFADLEPFLPMVDLWFWGNDHYCALFDRTSDMPISGCIGHGGYPYHLSEYGLDEAMSLGPKSYAPPVWVEAEPRYPRYTGMRQELGNNGYLELSMYLDRRIELVFKDWMARERRRVVLGQDADGRLSIQSSK